ncbi:hypothetical protein RhiirC2_803633, partial [Rhizophagus irregularis]
STLVKNPIPIVYLPWWDTSNYCLTWCRYCLTTNIIFGITEQSKCRKCKRVIDIDVTCIDEYNLKNFARRIFIINNNIVNWENNIKQGSNLMDSAYQFIREFDYCNDFNPIKVDRQIRFISFSNNMCDYCGFIYSSTIFFEQKYCKYCLYLYRKDLSDKNNGV